MIWKLKNLLTSCNENKAQINGEWVPARPILGPFVERVGAAWLVLKGKADAVVWPENQ